MWVVPNGNSECDSALLSSTHQKHLLHLHIATNTEHAQMSAVDLLLLVREQSLQLLHGIQQEIQLIHMMLSEEGITGP